VKIERGFPHASYIVYDTCASQIWERLTDLGLVSVVAHATERGYRGALHSLTGSILAEIQKLDAAKQNTGRTIKTLRTQISELAAAQQSVQRNTESYYEIRRNLIRNKGLVKRIQQICGGLDGARTYFDIVCEDALSIIDDEFSVSQEEIATSFKSISDRLSSLYDELNNEYNKLSNKRIEELQRLGYLLQSTGVAFLVFQIVDKLLFPDPSNPDSALLGSPTIHAFVMLGITAITAIVAYVILSRSFENSAKKDDQ
jgi:uncharacterized protein YihD (DUF1040 family)